MPFRMTHDEGPQPDDIERFGHDDGYCPECGNRVSDYADLCPNCNAWITGDVLPEPPIERGLRKRIRLFVIGTILVGFVITIYVAEFGWPRLG